MTDPQDCDCPPPEREDACSMGGDPQLRQEQHQQRRPGDVLEVRRLMLTDQADTETPDPLQSAAPAVGATAVPTTGASKVQNVNLAPKWRPGYGVPLMVFDVESIGLHGEGFAVGWIVVFDGVISERTLLVSHPDDASGSQEGRQWVMENVWPKLCHHPLSRSAHHVREAFWMRWEILKRGVSAMLMADCPWPVEANFLSLCIHTDPKDRQWNGPYPLLDAATLRAFGHARGADDAHDPLQDAIATWESVK